MTAITGVPLVITPEAQERLNELGFQAELGRMVEYARQVVPQLVNIEVTRFIRYDEDSPDGLRVTATTAKPWRKGDDLSWRMGRWEVETFPPEVLEHMTLDLRPLTIDDAG